MSETTATAPSFPAPPRPAGTHSSVVLSKQHLIDVACLVFLLGASTGLRALLPAFFAGERYFWALADFFVIAWFLLKPGQVFAYARHNRILISWGLLACLSMIWSLRA